MPTSFTPMALGSGGASKCLLFSWAAGGWALPHWWPGLRPIGGPGSTEEVCVEPPAPSNPGRMTSGSLHLLCTLNSCQESRLPVAPRDWTWQWILEAEQFIRQ